MQVGHRNGTWLWVRWFSSGRSFRGRQSVKSCHFPTPLESMGSLHSERKRLELDLAQQHLLLLLPKFVSNPSTSLQSHCRHSSKGYSHLLCGLLWWLFILLSLIFFSFTVYRVNVTNNKCLCIRHFLMPFNIFSLPYYKVRHSKYFYKAHYSLAISLSLHIRALPHFSSFFVSNWRFPFSYLKMSSNRPCNFHYQNFPIRYFFSFKHPRTSFSSLPLGTVNADQCLEIHLNKCSRCA